MAVVLQDLPALEIHIQRGTLVGLLFSHKFRSVCVFLWCRIRSGLIAPQSSHQYSAR
jgi:hypothetical protein